MRVTRAHMRESRTDDGATIEVVEKGSMIIVFTFLSMADCSE